MGEFQEVCVENGVKGELYHFNITFDVGML